MAFYSITVQNATGLNIYGLAPTTKWGAATFGVSKWGEGSEDLDTIFIKQISESVTPSDSVQLIFIKGISETLTVDSDAYFFSLYDSNGWNYVFHLPTNNADLQYNPTWTDDASETDAWTADSDESDNWTQA